MAKTDFKSVDQYMASLPEAVRNVLERVRATIRKAVPGGDEVISYQIPPTNCAATRCFTSPDGSNTIPSTPPTISSLSSRKNWRPTR